MSDYFQKINKDYEIKHYRRLIQVEEVFLQLISSKLCASGIDPASVKLSFEEEQRAGLFLPTQTREEADYRRIRARRVTMEKRYNEELSHRLVPPCSEIPPSASESQLFPNQSGRDFGGLF